MAINYRNIKGFSTNSSANNLTAYLIALLSQNQENRRKDENENQKDYNEAYNEYLKLAGTGFYDLAEPFLNLMYKYEKQPGVVVAKPATDLNQEFLENKQADTVQRKYLKMLTTGSSDDIQIATNYFKEADNLLPHIQAEYSAFTQSSYYQNSDKYESARNSRPSDITAYNTYIKPYSNANQYRAKDPRAYANAILAGQQAGLIEEPKPGESLADVNARYIEQYVLPDLLEVGHLNFKQGGHTYKDYFDNVGYKEKENVISYLKKKGAQEYFAYNPQGTKEEGEDFINSYVREVLPGLEVYEQGKKEASETSISLREIATQRKASETRIEELKQKQNKIRPGTTYYGAGDTGQDRIDALQKQIDEENETLSGLNNQLDLLRNR